MPHATERLEGALRGQLKVNDIFLISSSRFVSQLSAVLSSALGYRAAQFPALKRQASSRCMFGYTEATTHGEEPIGQQERRPGLSGPYTAKCSKGSDPVAHLEALVLASGST